MIYFDNNATTKCLSCVAVATQPFLTKDYANLSSAYARVSGLSETVARANARIREVLSIERAEQLVFTSGATESNNLAIVGAAKANARRRHIIISNIEHPSVSEAAEALRKEDYRISVVTSSRDGVIRLQELESLLSHETLLVSAMLANNESGVIQPIAALAEVVKRFDSAILVHTDATQAVGKITVDLEGDLAEVDLLSFSAHKFHGPKGVGGLYVRDLDRLSPILHGGGQQNGLRSGTENPGSIVGMAAALADLMSMQSAAEKMKELVKLLEDGVMSAFPDAIILGASAKRIPNTLYMCLPGVDAEHLVDQMAMREIVISAGSACSFGALRPSHVALALGLTYEQAKCCVRLSLSVYSTEHEVSDFLATLREVLSKTEIRLHTREGVRL